jgi:hypothetical protein
VLSRAPSAGTCFDQHAIKRNRKVMRFDLQQRDHIIRAINALRIGV